MFFFFSIKYYQSLFLKKNLKHPGKHTYRCSTSFIGKTLPIFKLPTFSVRQTQDIKITGLFTLSLCTKYIRNVYRVSVLKARAFGLITSYINYHFPVPTTYESIHKS